MKIIIVPAMLLLIAACANTSREEAENHCMSVGTPLGTQEFRECVLRQDNHVQSNRLARASVWSGILGGLQSNPQPYQFQMPAPQPYIAPAPVYIPQGRIPTLR